MLCAALIFGSLPMHAAGQLPSGLDAATASNPADSQPAKRQPLTFWQIIFSGGPLGIANMVVLIGLSIAALALALDDLRIVRKSRLIPDGLSEEVRDLMTAGELNRARLACKAHPSFLAA